MSNNHPLYILPSLLRWVALRSEISSSAIFLIHAFLEAPIAIQGILSPRHLPFLDLNNTSIVFIKVCFFWDPNWPSTFYNFYCVGRIWDMVGSSPSGDFERLLFQGRWIFDWRSVLQLYAAIVFATCIMSVLCYPLPGKPFGPFYLHTPRWSFCIEYFPGKRALAIALCIYHSVSSTILYGAPRFVPISFGHWAETWVTCFLFASYISSGFLSDSIFHCPLRILRPLCPS
jgi:hypothetical protein